MLNTFRVTFALWLVVAFNMIVCLSIVTIWSQESVLKTIDKNLPRQRIAQIIAETIRQGEGTVEGVKYYTRIPVSTEHIDEIKKHGDDAAAILGEYVTNQSIRTRSIAVELLGKLGGTRIVNPLQLFIENDPAPMVRELALRYLTVMPWKTIEPIIRKAAENDADKDVRQLAKELLRDRSKR